MTDSEVGIERPPGYSDEEWEAYKDGARRMLELSGSFLLSMAGDIDGPSAPEAIDGGDDTNESESTETDDEEYPETCPDCEMELVYEMGEEEPYCPNCDLLDD